MLEVLVIFALVLQFVLYFDLRRRGNNRPEAPAGPEDSTRLLTIDVSDLDRELEENEKALEAFDAKLSPKAPVKIEDLASVETEFYEQWVDFLIRSTYRGKARWYPMDRKQRALKAFRDSSYLVWKDINTSTGYQVTMGVKEDRYEVHLLRGKSCWFLHIHNTTHDYVVMKGAYSDTEKASITKLLSLARARATKGVVPTKLKAAISDLETK